MNISNEKKIDILLIALKERYDSIHKIRDRVQTVGIWTLGLLSAASGWIIQDDKVLSVPEKTLFIAGILVAFILFRFFYLEDLKKGFRGQQRIAADLEKALGFYEKKLFNDNDTTLYPESWAKAGTEEGEGRFFSATQSLLWAGVIFLILSILLSNASKTSRDCFHYGEHLLYSLLRY